MICVEFFFPEQPVHGQNQSAIKLRKILVLIVIGHLAALVLSLTSLLMSTLLAQIFYILILYSIYMTLRECMLWVYVILILFNVIIGLFTFFMYKGYSFIVYSIILAFYIGILIIFKKKLQMFRNVHLPNRFSAGINHMFNNARE